MRREARTSALEHVLLAAAVAAVLVAVAVGMGSIVKDAIDRSGECNSSHGTSTTCPTPAP